ncbi:MAG: D-ribose pyranase [Candidatus Promineofilum sp.]|nr:D-ribose pyranase [Promineifilum sp.]
MKKIGVLNKDLSEVIASMGHKDMLVIGDAGLPIPRTTRRIDLAIRPGLPSFGDVIETIKQELYVETVIIAEETKEISPVIYQEIRRIYPESQVQFVTHDELKSLTGSATAIVRTGEFTPYANVILVSGVVF